MIAQQVVAIGTDPDARVLALADDTDVFVLLLFFLRTLFSQLCHLHAVTGVRASLH